MIRVAVAGIGSCCSSFVQLLEMAKKKPNDVPLSGISHPYIGEYAVSDISVVAGFDVDSRKVGKDLAEAIEINDAVVHFKVPKADVVVAPGPVLDGVEGPLGKAVPLAEQSRSATVEDVTRVLREQSAEVLICSIPSGSNEAVKMYAEAAASVGVAFVNCTAAPAANDDKIAKLFYDRGVPLLGDDLRSHLGATTIHTTLLELLAKRGVKVLGTYQLNVGGNNDFLNLSNHQRSDWKVTSKKRALHASADVAEDVWAGPNGYIPCLGDKKVCHLAIDGMSVLGSRVSIDLKLEVEDSPNAASVMANAARVAALARRTGAKGILAEPSGYLFKSPTTPVSPTDADGNFSNYISTFKNR